MKGLRHLAQRARKRTLLFFVAALAGCGSKALGPGADAAGLGGSGGSGMTAGAGGSAGAGADAGAAGGAIGTAGAIGSGGAGAGTGGGGSGGAPADAGAGGASCSGTCVVPFVSSSDWAVYDDDPASNPGAQRLGAAQPVCLNARSPSNCPTGAVLYGFGTGWQANLASIPGALWVWGPGVVPTGAADLERFAFVHTFTLGAAPAGTLSVAADDAVEVRVNGSVVGTSGSVTDMNAASQASTTLKSFDLSSRLVTGPNTITVFGQNGPASYAGCPSACTYSANPAGVVFGGTLSYR